MSTNAITALGAPGLAACADLVAFDASRNALARWPLPCLSASDGGDGGDQTPATGHHVGTPLGRLQRLNLSFNASLPYGGPAAFACCPDLRELNLSGAYQRW